MNRDAAAKIARLLLERWKPVGAMAFPDESEAASPASATCNATSARLRESEPEQRAPAVTGGRR